MPKRIDNDTINLIKSLIAHGDYGYSIADKAGVSQVTVSKIKRQMIEESNQRSCFGHTAKYINSRF